MSVSKPSARKYIEESPTNTPPSPKRRRPSSPYPRGLSDSLRNLLESVAYLAPTDPSIAPIQEQARKVLEDSDFEAAEELSEEISVLSSLTLQFQEVEGIPTCVQEIYSRIVAIHFSNCPAMHRLSDRVLCMPRLQSLQIDQTAIQKLPFNIGNLSSLTELQINRYDFRQLPLNFFRLSRLITLVLKNGPLQTIDNHLAFVTSLQKLDLSHSELATFPLLPSRSQLISLNLSYNRIPTWVFPWNTPQLTELNLSGNPLKSLPKFVLTNLTALKAARFCSMQLAHLSPDISHLRQLETLELSNNQLKTIPPEIRRLTNLTFLNLAQNQLPQIPNLRELTKLTTLNIAQNPLIPIPPGCKVIWEASP